MRNSKTFIAPLILVVLLGAIFASSFFSHRSSIAYSDTDPAYNRAYWKQEIANLGPAKAYTLFKQENAKAPALRQHFSSHVIGELLYEKLGIDGIAVCDSTFGFGCYHGFFGQAIASGGSERIAELDSACVKAYSSLGTGCQHGLGHGILEYAGYTRLNDALALCKKTTQLVPLLGCTSGVFMEYNTPLVSKENGAVPTTRQLDPKDPHAPCPSVPAENRASCYFELGQWYRITLGADRQKLNSLCGTLDGSDRTHCFLGLGAITVAFDGYVLPKAKAECDAFAPADMLSCRAGVSWSFFANPPYRAQAPEACAYPDPAKEKECLSLADLTQGLDDSKQQHAKNP